MYRVLRAVSAMLTDIGIVLSLFLLVVVVVVVVALVVLSGCWCAFICSCCGFVVARFVARFGNRNDLFARRIRCELPRSGKYENLGNNETWHIGSFAHKETNGRSEFLALVIFLIC
jgi:hypothetical protein